MIIYLISGITFGFAAAGQPGPFQTFLISRALSYGWRHTLPAAFAPLLSDIPIVALVVFILSSIPIWVVNLLNFAGGGFLLFLAYGAFLSYKNYTFDKNELLRSKHRNFLKAAFVNLLNPNPYLFWALVMGPLLLKSWRETPFNGIALVLSFYVAMIAVNAAIVLVFATIRKLGPKINRILVGVSAIALTGFGIYQIWLGTTSLWFD
jgi:threonine/homoserine/homoserine lactone efflux protein